MRRPHFDADADIIMDNCQLKTGSKLIVHPNPENPTRLRCTLSTLDGDHACSVITKDNNP